MDFGIDIPSAALWVIIPVVCGYFLMVTFFGMYFSRFSSNINDFFFSGQRFAWWLPFVSMMATGIGSYSYLKYSEQGLKTGMNSAMGYMNEWFIIPLFFFAWLPIMYFSRIKSVPEYFERRFGRAPRYITVFILLCYIFYYIGYNLFTIGIAFEGIFGLPPLVTLPIAALLLGAYVTMGGQTAVIFTDLVQGVILYLVGFLVFGFGLFAIGGWGEFFGWLPLEHRLPFAPFREDPHFNSVGMFWGDAVAGSIAFLFLNQGFLMRFLSIRSVNEARLAGMANVLITLPLSAIVVGSVGWLAKAILQKQEALGQPLEGARFLEIGDSYHTFVTVAWFVIQQHPLILGLVLAALLAALMSTIDTLINAASAIAIYDIYKPLVRPEASRRHYLKAARLASMLSTVIGLLLVVWFYRQKGTLMSIHYKGIMMIIPSVVTVLLLGLLWNRFNSRAAAIALTAGAGVSFLTLFFPEWIYPLRRFAYGSLEGDPFYFRALFGMLITASAAVAVTLCSKPAPKSQIKGFTLDTIDEAMASFKGGKPNLLRGKKAKHLRLCLDSSLPEGQVSAARSAAEALKAQASDIVYAADQRWWLGGLRSGHFRLAACHSGGEGELRLSEATLKKSYLLPDRPVFIKKII